MKNKFTFQGFKILCTDVGKALTTVINLNFAVLGNLFTASAKSPYNLLIGSFFYLVIFSIEPLYYLFIGEASEFYRSGSYDENGDWISSYDGFRFAVILFLSTCAIYFVVPTIKIYKLIQEEKNNKN